MFFDGWRDVGRVLALTAMSYVLLVAALRVLGNRTLAKMSAFDLVVTVALGSTLATIALSSQVSLAEGASALLTLALAQFAVAWTAARWTVIRRLANNRPIVLVIDGQIDSAAIRSARVTPAEVHQAIRNSGIGDVSTVAAVVLETDGSMSVIGRDQMGGATSMPEL